MRVRSSTARAVVTSTRTSPRDSALERLHALAGDLEVRLHLAEPLARRVEAPRRPSGMSACRSASHRSASGTPSATTAKNRVGQPARERGEEHGVARPTEPGHLQRRARSGKRGQCAVERRQPFEAVEQGVERH